MDRRYLNGATVKALRESLGIQHGIFARDVEISAGYLTNIEKGARQPTPVVVRRLAARLGVSVDAITYVVTAPDVEPAAVPVGGLSFQPSGTPSPRTNPCCTPAASAGAAPVNVGKSRTEQAAS